MLDLKFLRENPDIVKKNIENKFQDQKLPLVDEVIELGCKGKSCHSRKQTICVQAAINCPSRSVQLMGQGKKEEAEAVKAQVDANAAPSC